jgi:hypothetical protein
VLDQFGCVYTPHVVSVTVGQKLLATNSGTRSCTTSTAAREQPAEEHRPAVKARRTCIPTKAAEQFKDKCDVHP